MSLQIHPLKIWLLENNMTQRTFSQITGLHEVLLSKILRGKHEPDLETIRKIYKGTSHKIDLNAFLLFKKGA